MPGAQNIKCVRSAAARLRDVDVLTFKTGGMRLEVAAAAVELHERGTVRDGNIRRH